MLWFLFEDYFHVLLLLHHLQKQSINRAKYLEQKRQNPFFTHYEYSTKAYVDHPALPSLVPRPTCSFFQALPPPHLSLSVYISWKKVGLLGCLPAFQNPRISFSFDSFLCVISPFLSYLYLNSICVKIVFADYSLHSVPFPNIPWNFMSTTSHFLETRLQFFFEARDIPSMWMLKMLKK